jgi:hypothetical protein
MIDDPPNSDTQLGGKDEVTVKESQNVLNLRISREPGEGEQGKTFLTAIMAGYMIFWPGTDCVL